MIDYNEACNRAATYQGLDPIMEALNAAGLEPDLWQSGGFCMIVVVQIGDTQVWITEGSDWGGPAGTAFYTAGHICHRSDEDYDLCEACHGDVDGEFVAFAELPELIRRLRGEV